MTQQIIDFFLGLKWQDWLTIGGFLFGIVTLIAFIEQRRSSGETAKLAKWAELNLDKSISEKEIKELLERKAEMEIQITQSIPALARLAVLKEQMELHRKAISEHFSAWSELSKELGTTTTVPGLEQHIQDAIVDRIIPRFQQEQEIGRLRTRITVLSVGVAVASAMLPFGLGSILAIFLAPALISAAFRLHALNEEPETAFKSLRFWVHLLYGVCTLGLAGFGVLLLLDGQRMTPFGIYVAWGMCGVGIALGLAYFTARAKIDAWFKNKIKNLAP